MSDNSIVGKAFRINEFDYFNCPKDVAVSCGALIMGGVVWFIPTSRNGVSTGYQQRRSQTKPTADSVKTIRVTDTVSGATYWILVNDGDTASAITDRCAACCGDLTDMPAVIVPTVVIEEDGCLELPPNTTGTYNYSSAAGALTAGQVYTLVGSKNGVAFTPEAPVGGFATVTAARIWANANWGTYGSFTSSGQTITFTSNNAITGSLQLTPVYPVVPNAGPDQALASGTTTTTLTSAGSTMPSGATRTWSKVSGPGTQVITTPAGATTTVTGLAAGTFVFRLSISAPGVFSSDDVTVVVAA